MISKQKNVARLERKQHKAEAALMSTRYPNVASLIIYMNYYQKSTGRTIMQRTVNFLPGSSAYFHMKCMEYDCVDGGFNLEPIINTMMKGRLKSGKGDSFAPQTIHQAIGRSITRSTYNTTRFPDRTAPD